MTEICIREGSLKKYSKHLRVARTRYCTLTENVNTSIKTLMTFKSVKDKQSPNKATEVIKMNDMYNVTEYYGSLNKKIDDLHFIVNDTFVFQCNSEYDRQEWIKSIIKTDHVTPVQNPANGNFNPIAIKDIKYKYEKLSFFQFECKQFDIEDNINTIVMPLEYKLKNGCTSVYAMLSIEYSSKVTMEKFADILIEIGSYCIYPKRLESVLLETEGFLLPKYSTLIKTKERGKLWQERKLTDMDTWGDTGNAFVYKYDKNALIKHGLVMDCRFNYYMRLNNLNDASIYANDEKKDKDNTDEKEKEKNNSKLGGLCKDGLNCGIYLKVKNNKHECTRQNYDHLLQLNHFNFDYSSKPICKNYDKCDSLMRMAGDDSDKKDEKQNLNGINSKKFDRFRLSDQCHLLIYRHPPRDGKYQMKHSFQSEMNAMIAQTDAEKLAKFDQNFTFDSRIIGIITEMINNGFENDLCLTNDDFQNKNYSILKIVNEKLQSKMHKINFNSCLKRDEMFALVLYTSCKCNYDLCKSQRNGDYKKWYYFDQCLYDAITKLNEIERYDKSFKLYSGLFNVQIKNSNSNDNDKQLENITQSMSYFTTYVSASYIKDISVHFARNNGMVIEMSEKVVETLKLLFC